MNSTPGHLVSNDSTLLINKGQIQDLISSAITVSNIVAGQNIVVNNNNGTFTISSPYDGISNVFSTTATFSQIIGSSSSDLISNLSVIIGSLPPEVGDLVYD